MIISSSVHALFLNMYKHLSKYALIHFLEGRGGIILIFVFGSDFRMGGERGAKSFLAPLFAPPQTSELGRIEIQRL